MGPLYERDGVAQLADLRAGDGDEVALLEADVHRLDDTGARREDGAGGNGVRAAEPVDDLRKLALELARAGGAAEDLPPAAVHAAGELQGVGIRDLVRGHDHGTEREAAVVDLRLRQVERVLALDVPGGHVDRKSTRLNSSHQIISY